MLFSMSYNSGFRVLHMGQGFGADEEASPTRESVSLRVVFWRSMRPRLVTGFSC